MKRSNVKIFRIESFRIVTSFTLSWLIDSNPFFRILSGGFRMPDMSVRAIEDIDLKMSDIEGENEPKEIQFNIEGEFYYNDR